MADGKKQEQSPAQRPSLAAMGMEAEFSLVIDDSPREPEQMFGTPRGFIRGSLMHREGTSYHLPTGGAVYFDTGVIEVATPVIEIEQGCAARAGRSLWESIRFIRGELDSWDAARGRNSRLVGFSAHYNVSFNEPVDSARTVEQLARLLTFVLPVPVMLLATNRRSTGVGVRPRQDRIEVTVDFTPSPSLMIATATVIVGVAREIMTWPSFDVDELVRRGLPVLRDFEPLPHSSRKGWVAHIDSYTDNPFTCDVDDPVWATRGHGVLSLRQIGGHTARHFWRSIRAISDPFTHRLIGSVLRGRSPSLLELDDRPAEYEDVGRLCAWDDLFPPAQLARSRYERVLIRAISGRRLRVGRRWLRPVGMKGWAAVIFRSEDNGRREVVAIDDLLGHLDAWERQ